MNVIDALVILAYFLLVLSAGIWFRRKASRDLEAYFLGGKSMHWSFLAMSGAVSNFDITGTMWMVSVLYILGMQSWWHHWMWGVALPAFALAYMARWVRRSKVMTAAEWMRTRFGDDTGGRVARVATALSAVILTAAVLGYAFQGIGKFAAVYVPLETMAEYLPLDAGWLEANRAHLLAGAVFLITTIYVVMGGFYSVVVTDFIQTLILTGAAILIAVVAYLNLTPEVLAERVPEGFTRLAPSWRLDHLAGTEHKAYQWFGLLTLAWVLKGFLMNAGGPSQQYDCQRYLAAASVRDACKMAAAWPLFLAIRWAMVMGITLLALTGAFKTTDPEGIMPVILKDYLPVGLRGLVVAGLIAAFMSTFSSTVNAGASFVVRDLWQPLFRGRAKESTLILASYVATLALVAAGVLIGCRADSIAQVWNWAMMALTAGVIVPCVLRWYWWRLNGWGFAMGVLAGTALSIALPQAIPDLPDYHLFFLTTAGSLVACVAAALATPPTDRRVLREFLETVRPFGFWGPVRAETAPLSPERAQRESPSRAALNTALAVAALTALYLGPMYLVGHWFTHAATCGALFIGAVIVLAFTWYRHLPED